MASAHPVHLVPLIALLLSACQAPPQGPLPSPTPSPGASSEAVSSPSPTPQTHETTILRGKVFDEEAAAVPDGTRVTARSLDSSVPFEASVTTAAGTYVVNGVPIGIQVSLTATRENWTSRSRVEVLSSNRSNSERRNIVNFGGTDAEIDPISPAYFLSNRPEIERVEPVDAATSLPNDRLLVRLVLSEPLSVENQRRLASAFFVAPNNTAAIADGTALPPASATHAELVGFEPGAAPLTDSAYRYRQNAGFFGAVSDFKWEPDGRSAVFTLQAPVKTGTDAEGQYVFALVQGDAERITDNQNNPLGMNGASQFGGTLAGQVLLNALREVNLNLSSSENVTPERRWADTHLSYTRFSVTKDTAAPQVTGIVARRDFSDETGSYDRIEVTFSEPMVSYPQIRGTQLLSLNNYILATAASVSEVEARKLDAPASAQGVTTGAAVTTIRDALKSANGMVVDSDAATSGTDFSLALSPLDPKVVIIKLPAGSLPSDSNAIKVHVGSDAGRPGGASRTVSDPAGNAIPAGGAAAAGTIQ